MDKFDKTSVFLILKQYYTKFSFIIIICDAIWRKTPKRPKIDSVILNVLRRFELALQDGIVKKFHH